MSGMGVIYGGRHFRASAHLLRGVAKLRTTVRKTSSTVPQELTIGDVKVQVLHVADRIRKYAPFPSHANEAITNNKENGLEEYFYFSTFVKGLNVLMTFHDESYPYLQMIERIKSQY
jgi:hypothetical protein